ncbi:hypothetical protein ACJIZ3_013422 [Penstemon smallii]|uniref:Patellin-1-6 C-terminal GOLD domain-containing protein n=1 Tax=Penstemon smallii TaxID=265156 RepID=A0ABD3UQ54_9LAMI
MSGVAREGHPICYNIFGVLDNEEIYEKTLGTEEKREQFLRWRKLDFKACGVNSLVQINDLKNSPGLSKTQINDLKTQIFKFQSNMVESRWKTNDFEFSGTDGEAVEVVIKGGTTETIEIPTPELFCVLLLLHAGTTFIWDMIVVGWEVNYTEEFVPTDERRKMSLDEAPIRKAFKNNEPGKIVLTVENCSGKKKRVFYRYKVKKACF